MISEAELAFLRARLDEIEADAKAATDGPWRIRLRYYGNTVVGADDADVAWPGYYERGDKNAAHIARHHPASALREVETWRRVLLEYATCGLDAKYKGTERETGYQLALSAMLRMRAYEYREHPDYAAAAAQSADVIV